MPTSCIHPGDIEGWLEFIFSVRVIIMYDGHVKLHQFMYHFIVKSRKHSSRMCTNRAVTRPSSEQVVISRLWTDKTPVKTLPFPCGR